MQAILKIKTEHKDLYREHSQRIKGDSGLDLFFVKTQELSPGTTTLVDLEISCEMVNQCEKPLPKIQNIPYIVVPRSSIYKTKLRMANSVGIIDKGYRGNIKVAIDNIGTEAEIIEAGKCLFQLCKPDLSEFKIKLVDSLSTSQRGVGGFGSTNK
jgi:dUTP pyrophosphatase